MAKTSIVSLVTFFQLIFTLISSCSARNGANAKFYDVTKYGAVGNGKADNSKQFLRAWEDACQWNGNSVMVIPKGIYMLNPVKFTGPCRGFIAVRINGDLKASTDISVESWITFKYVDRLLVDGGGTIDGQGAAVWSRANCIHNHRVCRPLPISMGFYFVTNSKIKNLNMINSKGVHLKLYRCQKVVIREIKITAPENSPNTDGISIAVSQDIKVRHCNIACGDDCVNMLTGNKNVEIFDVACGPGHGISVGSLGHSLGESTEVTGLHVKNCSLRGTTNGLRIKTWAPSGPGLVSNFLYEDIHMQNADNPIIIDQQYCPSGDCNNQAQSSIQVKNVTFRNIWGQSSTPVAVKFQCSKKVPCYDFKLQNINLAYNGREGILKSQCMNVHGQFYGQQQPRGCF
ncbi:putative glycoside hydrolase, family 28, Pectin lyase fold/virulence factor [Heracleum sosnowskyi]|uniref:Glycoside hydrolase, family 28, Pectin lyase fold/virulence factor n=1 Tax=Heracleum sosnowskyi TaxID=360622 RepID=A0AAD8JJD2_9APIA|nr:putative glycoside hydrolase, family 28, Pectin lyase fold/virulence factor [Heracleum sosnowskyi]